MPAMAWRMDQATIIVLAVVGSLGLLSTIMGFSAEGTKISHPIYYYGSCYYPANPALGLGVCAAIFLLIAQVAIAVAGGCYGSCMTRAIPAETNRTIVIVCAVFSWIATAIAFGLFVRAASLNSTGWRDAAGYGLCYVVQGGMFAGAAVLALAATALGVASYVLLRRLPDAAPAPVPVVIATAQPQTPPNGNGQTPQFSPRPAQVSVAHAPNQQFSPPAEDYEAQGPNQQFPLPDPGHGAHAPNQHRPPPAQAYAAQAPTQFDYAAKARAPRVATSVSEGEPYVHESTSKVLAPVSG